MTITILFTASRRDRECDKLQCSDICVPKGSRFVCLCKHGHQFYAPDNYKDCVGKHACIICHRLTVSFCQLYIYLCCCCYSVYPCCSRGSNVVVRVVVLALVMMLRNSLLRFLAISLLCNCVFCAILSE